MNLKNFSLVLDCRININQSSFLVNEKVKKVIYLS